MNQAMICPLILVVEDDKDYQELLERGHKRSQISCEFKIVDSAEEAFQYLENHHTIPNLILLDYDLPGMDGLQMVEKLKKSSYRALPILMFSVHNRPQLIEQAYEKGVSSFIPKPDGYTSIIELWHSICTFWGEYASLPKLT